MVRTGTLSRSLQIEMKHVQSVQWGSQCHTKDTLICRQWEALVSLIVSPQKIFWHPNPQDFVNMTLSGNRDFANVIKWRWGHTRLRWSLIQYEWCLHKKTDGTEGECHVKMQRECNVTMEQRLEWCIYESKNTKNSQLHQKRERMAWNRFPSRALRVSMAW